MNKKLSFILPCYNVEHFISECLDSLYNQDMPESEYEVICVNDCSLDGTRDIIVEYQKQHPNLILIDHEVNKKQGGARNTGLCAAQGEYIWFVDPDDYIKPNVLGKLFSIADVNELDILQFNIDTTDKDDRLKIRMQNSTEDSKIISGYEYLKTLMNTHWGREVEVWRRIYNRSFLINENLFFPDYFGVGEDAVFFYNSILECSRFKQITDSNYIYRTDNENSTMNSNNLSGIKLAERLFSNIETINVFYNAENIKEPDFKEKAILTYIWSIKKLRRKIIKLSTSERKKFYDKIKNCDFSTLKIYSHWYEHFIFTSPFISLIGINLISPIVKIIKSILK